MRNILILGALTLLVVLVVVNGPTISHKKFSIRQGGQSAAAVLMYDDYGNPQWVEEAYPGSITNNPSDIYYTTPGIYVPEVYYSSDPYTSYSYTTYGPYYGDSYYDDSSSYNYYPYTNYYDSSPSYSYAAYYTPPPPPPQPWYVQAFPGVGSVAQTIVQGIAPQTQPRSTQYPSCAISANPSSVPFSGSTALRWISQATEWADLSDLGTVDPSGSWQFDGLTRTRMFTLNVFGPGGTGTCSTVVTVLPRR